ncbi:MAG: hypothetical protein ACI9D5_001030 [Candidatus Endobugula sp.]|jgi:hypothetical protein
MQDNIYQQLLSLTEKILAMANNNNWAAVAEYESQRQQLIIAIKKNNLRDEKEAETIKLLSTITAMNISIDNLASQRLNDDKASVLKLQKTKKAHDSYQA